MLGSRDEKILGGLYALDAALVVSAFFHLAAQAAPLSSVWKTFLAYQLLRSSQFGLRVFTTAMKRRPRRRRQHPELKLA